MSEVQLDIPALVEEFHDQGFLILRDILTPEKVNRMNQVIDELIVDEPDDSLAYNIYNSVERHEEIASLIDQPTILPLMVNLMGFNIQLHISHLTIRKPNPNDLKTNTSSFINWHQDGPHPQFPKINGLTSTYYIKTCYILSDMSEPNRGNTKVIPGSHKIPNFAPENKDVDAQLTEEVQICGKPGDVFVFPQNIWHSGAPNRSNFTRRQLFLGYSPIWIRPIDYHRASGKLLQDANPIRRQLLGEISDNCFKYYVPEESMVPLKALYLGDIGKGSYDL